MEPFARFHFAGHWDPDGRAMIAAIARAVGRPDLRAWPLPWGLMRLAAPFHETARELVATRPFWRAPIRLDNARLVAALGAEPHTPLDVAMTTTLRGLGCLPVDHTSGRAASSSASSRPVRRSARGAAGRPGNA